MTSPWMLKYSAIPYLASVLAGIMWYHDWVGMIVVDALLEDIRIGLEINHPRLNQRRIACLRYLGEMYNYRVCDSAIIFKVLISF
jgi:regulator of nonsense transcripts 2